MTETLFVTDAEMIQRLGVPEKIASVAIPALDRDPRSGFPREQKLWGNRRYWPAIRHYFDIINGIAEDTHGFMRGGRDIVLWSILSMRGLEMTSNNDAITLKDAAKQFGFSVSTLRTEAERGRLTIYRIGRRYYTTPADIREMVLQCRVEPKAPTTPEPVMSEAEQTSAAMAAVKEAMLVLRKG